MYMQIRKYRVVSGNAEALCRQAAQGFLPIVKQLKGFVDYMIIDNQNGDVMSVNIFENKDGLEESNRKAHEWHVKNAREQLEGPLEVIEGEVLVNSSGFLERAKKAA